jgi:hypothetical protein
VSVNGNGRGNEIWGAARLVAPAVVALVLAGVALPLILDSGTARLPAVGVSVGTGPGSALAPVEKIVVTTPSKSPSGAQHHANQSAASAAPAQTSLSAGSTASSSPVSGQAVSGPVVQPAQHSPAAANQTAKPPKAVTKPGSGSQTPQATPKPPASTEGQGDEGEHGQSQSSTSHPGRALGHQKHEFFGKTAHEKAAPPRGRALGHQKHKFGKAAHEKSEPPWGRALGRRDHVPPGQARAHSESHHGHGSDEQGDSQGDDNDQGDDSHGDHGNPHDHASSRSDSGEHGHSSPGHGDGSHGAHSHGRGHGH